MLAFAKIFLNMEIGQTKLLSIFTSGLLHQDYAFQELLLSILEAMLYLYTNHVCLKSTQPPAVCII